MLCAESPARGFGSQWMDKGFETTEAILTALKTCPAPCADGTVHITLEELGFSRSCVCPILSPNCSYGKKLAEKKELYLRQVLNELSKPLSELELPTLPPAYVPRLPHYKKDIFIDAILEWNKEWNENRKKTLVLSGGNGGCSGKSLASIWAIQEYISAQIDWLNPTKWGSVEHFKKRIMWRKASTLAHMSKDVSPAYNMRFLVIDDLGEEPDNKKWEWVSNAIREILDVRYMYELPTVITTRLNIDQLRNRYGHHAFLQDQSIKFIRSEKRIGDNDKEPIHIATKNRSAEGSGQAACAPAPETDQQASPPPAEIGRQPAPIGSEEPRPKQASPRKPGFIESALASTLSVHEKMVYIALCSQMDKHGACPFSVQQLIGEAGCCRTKVFDALKKLEGLELVLKTSPKFYRIHDSYEFNNAVRASEDEWFQFIRSVLTYTLSIYEKIVYIALSAHVNEHDFCSPSVEQLCSPSVEQLVSEVACQRTKVFSALKKLEELGLISRVSRPRQSGERHANLYKICSVELLPAMSGNSQVARAQEARAVGTDQEAYSAAEGQETYTTVLGRASPPSEADRQPVPVNSEEQATLDGRVPDRRVDRIVVGLDQEACAPADQARESNRAAYAPETGQAAAGDERKEFFADLAGVREFIDKLCLESDQATHTSWKESGGAGANQESHTAQTHSQNNLQIYYTTAPDNDRQPVAIDSEEQASLIGRVSVENNHIDRCIDRIIAKLNQTRAIENKRAAYAPETGQEAYSAAESGQETNRQPAPIGSKEQVSLDGRVPDRCIDRIIAKLNQTRAIENKRAAYAPETGQEAYSAAEGGQETYTAALDRASPPSKTAGQPAPVGSEEQASLTGHVSVQAHYNAGNRLTVRAPPKRSKRNERSAKAHRKPMGRLIHGKKLGWFAQKAPHRLRKEAKSYGGRRTPRGV